MGTLTGIIASRKGGSGINVNEGVLHTPQTEGSPPDVVYCHPQYTSFYLDRFFLTLCWEYNLHILNLTERKIKCHGSKKSKVGDHCRGPPEDSLFNSYYTDV